MGCVYRYRDQNQAFLELFRIDPLVPQDGQLAENIIHYFGFSTDVKFRVLIEMLFDEIYPS